MELQRANSAETRSRQRRYLLPAAWVGVFLCLNALSGLGEGLPEAGATPLSAEAPRLFPAYLTAARAKAAANTPQWRAFRSRLVANLPKVLSYSYEGSMASWISDYAAGAVCEHDAAMAQSFAD